MLYYTNASGCFAYDLSIIFYAKLIIFPLFPILQLRWVPIVKPMAAQINKTVFQVIDLLPEGFAKEILSKIDGKEDQILDAFPAPFGDELR